MKTNKFVIRQLGRDYAFLQEIETQFRTRSTDLTEVIGGGDPEPALEQCANHLREVADFIDGILNARHDYNPKIYIDIEEDAQ